ncbi:GGDEF domain [Comamonadaceae bacterium]
MGYHAPNFREARVDKTASSGAGEKQRPRPIVVGIGASAGGLEALTAFVSGLTPALGCIYVVAQHMAPSHRSLMAEILGRETSLPVREALNGETPEPDVVYIVPAGTNLVLAKGVFRLTTPPPEVSPKPSINLLFQSIAKEYDDMAVGIVLSGTGADGSRGLLAIKAAGGLTMVQIPESAKYDGMPRSAIEAGVADRVLAPEHMGADLERLVRFPGTLEAVEAPAYPRAELDTLFERVRDQTRIDFSSYKLSTVQRRLQRRVLAVGVKNLQDYLAYTEKQPEELDTLAKDTLISVTEFFRDRDAFAALERSGAELVARKGQGDELRIWVIGCATGEEAYSVGMVFLELLRQHSTNTRLQIFATDIDNDALTVARRGHYSLAAMAEMPRAYLDRYYQPSGEGYEPVKALRDCVTFARQDITVDPPFLRLDLVTCRNVLIYFNNELQAKVLSVIRYSLNDDGLLFLGRSETVSQQEALFAVADRRARIYRSRAASRPVTMGALSRGSFKSGVMVARKPPRTHEQVFAQALAAHVGPAMLLDSGLRILHSQGPVGTLLVFPTGTPEMNLAQLIVPELSGELISTMQRAHKTGTLAYSRRRRIAACGGETWRLGLRPVSLASESQLFLVVFEEGKGLDGAQRGKSSTDTGAVSDDTRLELDSAREQLQTLMEEMAASNEEMQALNEEVQAANEELQASNEELEAANEELQATNEELISVNEESQIKSAALASVNSEFESMYNTLDFPVLVFDTLLCLRRINGTAIRAYSLPATNVGQHISRLKLPDYLNDIGSTLQASCASTQKALLERQHGDKTYQLQINPVLNMTASVQGVVLVVLDNTELVSAQQRIRESQEQLASIMAHSVSAVSVKDSAGCYEFVNARFEDLMGLSAADVLGKTDQQIFPAPLATRLRGHDLDTMRQGAATETVEHLQRHDGELWLSSVRFPIRDHAGVVRSICTESNDITVRRKAEEQLRLAAKVFDHAGEAIAILDPRGHLLNVNRTFTKITGFVQDEVIGRDVFTHLGELQTPDLVDGVRRQLAENGVWQGEVLNRRKNGEIFPQWLTVNAVMDDDGALQSYVLMFSDITAMKHSQQRIEFIASHDELTGLPNRGLLTDRLRHALAQGKRRQQRVAVLFIDLDNFKNVNDTLGHDVGDMLLVQAAQRLGSCVRDSDTLARLGGDEFVAVLSEVDLNEVNTIAGRIVDFMSASFPVQGNNLFVSASIGISVYPDDGDDSITLLKNADTAMYRAKERGRNQYQYFAHEMKVNALQRMTLETGLRVALQQSTLKLVYQPKVSLAGIEIVGGEALLRWSDEVLGDISPAKFIPVAEASGLINELGFYVIDRVLSDIAHWRRQGLEVPRIAINVSAHQLKEPSFVERFSAKLSAAGVPPSQIIVELTESALMERLDALMERLFQLTRLGVDLSVDDFGTGYSSLAYLRKFPIHELKVDRSFVDGIATEPDDRSIAKMIINMAQTLGLRVVAEGVETAQQLEVLRAEGCEIGQGYFFHKPMAPESFAQLLKPALSEA